MKKKTIRQSKRLIISLFVTFFCLTASAAQAQTALVTIDLQQVKMVQVMDEIENQTKYLFIYDKNMDTGRLVNVHVTFPDTTFGPSVCWLLTVRIILEP